MESIAQQQEKIKVVTLQVSIELYLTENVTLGRTTSIRAQDSRWQRGCVLHSQGMLRPSKVETG